MGFGSFPIEIALPSIIWIHQCERGIMLHVIMIKNYNLFTKHPLRRTLCVRPRSAFKSKWPAAFQHFNMNLAKGRNSYFRKIFNTVPLLYILLIMSIRNVELLPVFQPEHSKHISNGIQRPTIGQLTKILKRSPRDADEPSAVKILFNIFRPTPVDSTAVLIGNP